MGYVLRVRLASFFTGVVLASVAGLYYLQKDYKVAHQAISQQMNGHHESLEGRVFDVGEVESS